MTFSRPALVFLVLTGTVCCGGSDVTTGAWAEFEATIPFSGATDERTESFALQDVEEIANISDDITCGYLADAESYIALTDYTGNDDNKFLLTATLVDGDDELELFSWANTLQAAKTQVLLSELKPNADALERLKDIIGVRKTNYKLRMKLSADEGTDKVQALLVQKIRVATAKGSCP